LFVNYSDEIGESSGHLLQQHGSSFDQAVSWFIKSPRKLEQD